MINLYDLLRYNKIIINTYNCQKNNNMDHTIEFCNELVSNAESESFRDVRMITIFQKTYDSLVTNRIIRVELINGYGG
jgi:hypothetical protein